MFNHFKKPITPLLALALIALGIAAAQAAAPPPTTVTVTDNFGPSHGNYLRWDRFSTDLSAAVQNAPQTNQETTITGPTYSWAVVSQTPSSPTFSIADSGNGNATLQSPIPSKTVCFIAGGGTYDVKVNCTITYTSTDNTTGAATPLGYSANPPLDVQFFVRVPVKVVSGGNKTHIPQGNGHEDAYPLEIIDNQATPQTYGNGLAHETFAGAKDGNGNPISDSGMNSGGPDTWTFNADGYGLATGTGIPVTNTFTDYWGAPNPNN